MKTLASETSLTAAASTVFLDGLVVGHTSGIAGAVNRLHMGMAYFSTSSFFLFGGGGGGHLRREDPREPHLSLKEEKVYCEGLNILLF